MTKTFEEFLAEEYGARHHDGVNEPLPSRLELMRFAWDGSHRAVAEEIAALLDNPGGDGNLAVALGRWLERNLPGYRFGRADLQGVAMSQAFEEWMATTYGANAYWKSQQPYTPDVARAAWDAGRAEGEAKLREFGKRLRDLIQDYSSSHLRATNPLVVVRALEGILALADKADPPEEAKE